MITYIESIELVKEFQFLNGSLFILTQSKIRNAATGKNIEGEFYCMRNWKNFILTQNKNEKNILILDKDLNVIKEISGASNYALWLLNACDLIPVEEKVFQLKDSLELEETKITIFPKNCIHTYGIRRGKNAVLCDDLEGIKLKWRFELGENIKVGGDFILLDKLVIVSTTTEDLIGIDIETGKELWRLRNCNLYQQKQPNTGYLIGLASNSVGDNFYQVVDPSNGVKLVYKKFKNFFYDTRPTLACITATHYYFISNVIGDGSGTASIREIHLGCINLENHEIEWVEKIDSVRESISVYKKPELINNRLYLLDEEKTLSIYELN